MRRSVLFFTFVLASVGCVADPATVSESDEEQNSSGPTIETGLRPPFAIGIDPVVRIDGDRSADQMMVARRVSDRAVIQAPEEAPHKRYCPAPPLCAEVDRRPSADP